MVILTIFYDRHIMEPIQAQYWRLDNRPSEYIADDTLSLQVETIDNIPEGSLLLRVIYLSLDATNRLWMADMKELYVEPVELGAPMLGFTVSEVVESKHSGFSKGELVVGIGHWAQYQVSDGSGLSKFVVPNGVPLADAFGVLAVSGPTAYFGLLDIANPRPGETVVISAAAGAVGALVGQIALMKGCRVVGIAGSDDKCEWLKDELKFDGVINYKSENLSKALERECPNGIDIHFENVGGAVLDNAMTQMNLNGRIVICGLISMYNAKGEVPGPRMFHNVIMKRLRIEGFVVLDYVDRYHEAQSVLSRWLQMEKLQYRLTIRIARHGLTQISRHGF
jgi:NADPH-dependent curcumin reductase CurA